MDQERIDFIPEDIHEAVDVLRHSIQRRQEEVQVDIETLGTLISEPPSYWNQTQVAQLNVTIPQRQDRILKLKRLAAALVTKIWVSQRIAQFGQNVEDSRKLLFLDFLEATYRIVLCEQRIFDLTSIHNQELELGLGIEVAFQLNDVFEDFQMSIMDFLH